MHPSPTTPVSYLNFYVICSYFQLDIKFWLVFQVCLIHIYLQYVPHFDSLIHSNIFLQYFLFVFCIGWQRFLLLFILVLHWWVVGLMICICIFISSVFKFFIEILSFGFCLVSSECDAYPPVDYSLVYGHSKMFLILSVESNLDFGLKPSFSIHISLSFCFLPLDLVRCRTFPPFIHNEC